MSLQAYHDALRAVKLNSTSHSRHTCIMPSCASILGGETNGVDVCERSHFRYLIRVRHQRSAEHVHALWTAKAAQNDAARTSQAVFAHVMIASCHAEVYCAGLERKLPNSTEIFSVCPVANAFGALHQTIFQACKHASI